LGKDVCIIFGSMCLTQDDGQPLV